MAQNSHSYKIINETIIEPENTETKYKIIKLDAMEAFKDKILGGIRGKSYKKEIMFLNNFDDFLVKKKILRGTTSLIVARKK